MSDSPENEQDEELQAHRQAYLQIFQAVLKKVPGEAAQKKERLARLRQYLLGNVNDVSAFIGHIPQFARLLGVKEAALSSFVGANFLRALTMVKERMAAQKVTAGAPAGGGGAGAATLAPDTGILDEILAVLGPLVQAPAHFEPHEQGFMKLVTPEGETLSMSLTTPAAGGNNGDSNGTENGAASQGASKTAAVSGDNKGKANPAPASETDSASNAPAPSKAPQNKGPSIIQEILNTFGSVLDVHEKLEPRAFLPEDEQTEGKNGATPAAETNDTASGEGSSPDPATPAAPAARAAKATRRPPETSIIAEILEKFGSVLDIPEKLEPSDGLLAPGVGESAAHGALSTAEGQGSIPAADDFPGASLETAPVPAVVEINPIPLSFQEYLGILKNLQQFQASGDRAAYQSWLSGPAGLAGKTLVGLRNLESRDAKGGNIIWDDEYYNLSLFIKSDQVGKGEVEDLHLRIKSYRKIQGLINQFKQKLKSLDPTLVGAVKKVWPQLVLLLGQPLTRSAYLSQFQITLLQIGDPGLKTRLEELVQPLFAHLEKIYGEIGK